MHMMVKYSEISFWPLCQCLISEMLQQPLGGDGIDVE